MSNILRVAFCGKQQVTAKSLYQYDYGQILKIIDLNLPTAYEVHFSNYERGESTTVLATSNEVTIPDTYLQSGRDVYVWIYLHAGSNDGETEYQITIPVIKRAKPVDEAPTPEEQSVITRTIAVLNNAVTESRASVERVEQIESNVNNVYSLVENDKTITYNYKEATETAVNQIRNSVQLGYITIGSTRLTEEQLIKLLQLIED